MRGFALLLMLANVAFFTWQQSWLPWLPWQPMQFKSSPSLPPAADLPEFMLLSEQPANDNTVAKEVSPTQPQDVRSPADAVAKEVSPVETKGKESAPAASEAKGTPSTTTVPKPKPSDNPPAEPVPPPPEKQSEVTLPAEGAKTETNVAVTEEKLSVPQQTAQEVPDTAPKETTTPPLEQLALKSLAVATAESGTPIPPPANEQQSASPTAKVGTKPAKQTTGTCLQIGAYIQRPKADEAVSWWKTRKEVVATVQPRQTQTLVATWVYLPSFKTQEEARKVQQRLAKQGIVDQMVISGGKHHNAISLGLYQDQLSVDRRLKELKSKGYNNVQIEKRYKSSTNYWLDVKILKGQSSELLTSFRKVFKGPPASTVKCESLTHD